MNDKEAAIALQLFPWPSNYERVSATVKHYMHLRWAVSVTLLSGVFANAQINSGTIVVFNQTPSGFFIAADSRANYDDPRAPDDNQCKISAFQSSHLVFATSGAMGYVSSGISDSVQTWNAHDEIAIPKKWHKPVPANATEALNRLTVPWANRMKNRWQETFLAHSEILHSVTARQRGGVLTKGIFAIAFKGKIAIAMVQMMYTEAGVKAVFYDDMKCMAGVTICGIGKIEVVSEHLLQGPFMSSSDQLSRLIKLVELTETEDKSGDVGGPIDALEMSNDGTITWKQKKEVCPKSKN